ncbi:hypothetical protein [Butyrivibrio fibrisolvens]|uniref:hypothetical protein n=1 Tax=Butyrivibrio fibrisolvens TaxID=831 RepID=UPI0003B7B22C|nr:hypothetical protein [Butyrivibrio fibrisolvens]
MDSIDQKLRKRKILIVLILFLILILWSVPKVINATFPKVMNSEDIAEDLAEQKYEGFTSVDLWDHLEINTMKETLSDLLSSGLDKDLWDKNGIWAQCRVLWSYDFGSIKDVSSANETLQLFYDKLGSSDISSLDVTATTVNGSKIYPASDKIKNAVSPAIQLFDIYIPVDSTLTEEDLAAIVHESKEDIKLVEVKWKKKGAEDPENPDGLFSNLRYIVYSDTEPENYESDYLMQLYVDTHDIKDLSLMTNFVVSVYSVSEDVKDNFYVNGGKHVEEVSLLNKVKYSYGVCMGYIHLIIGSLKIIGQWAAADLIVIIIFFPTVFLILYIIVTRIVIPILRYIIYILDSVLSFFAGLFGK